QPEVAAEAILFAAEHRRRELLVGWPTLQAVIGNKIAPAIGDMVLAKNGYEGQQTNEPEDPNRQDNLWEPLPGDHGAHGRFDEQAREFSPQLWVSMNRKYVFGSLLAAVSGFLGYKLANMNNR